jgi:hypothetical protein
MRRPLLLAAALVVLIANGWAVLQAWRNRAEPRGGRLELTERELRLEPAALESTAMLLDLRWQVPKGTTDRDAPPDWLDAAKLSDLGFDCRLGLETPSAPRHYHSMPPRPAYLVLEYRAQEPPGPTTERNTASRLFVIDAAPQPAALRARYSDPARHVISQGLVGLVYRDRDREGTRLPNPKLEGRVLSVVPGQIFVPLPFDRVLREFQRTDFTPEGSEPKEPRYAVTVCWGANYEPWITSVRPLK